MTSSFRPDMIASWDAIAESFNLTRSKPWPLVLDFLNTLPLAQTVYDLGCGNGRHLLPATERNARVVGVDFSRRLLAIAEKKIQQKKLDNVFLAQADLVQLPFCDESADAVLFIAALHNIKTRKNRVKALQEVNRVLKADGAGLITVWSRWQDAYRWHFFKQLFAHRGEFGDIEIRWRQHRLDVPRFYHLYSRLEFQNDLTSAGLAVHSMEKVCLGHRASPDNYVALVARK
jgi:tRNA (uracil-5-)-methyltransferase TRM9